MAVILAGGEGERLSILSQERAKPAVPFGGKYRIIDFTLSNCVNSDIDDVVVLTQYNPRSLNDHIGLGRPWDLDRNRGGVKLLQPYIARGRVAEWYRGTLTVNQLSGGRLTLGIGLGARGDDYEASGVEDKDKAEKFETFLDYLEQTFADERIGPRGAGVPRILIGGHVDAAFRRAARYGEGWIAGGAPPDQYAEMAAGARKAWADAGKDGEPRLAGLAYFALGDTAEQDAQRYLTDYYGFLGEETAQMIAGSAATDADTVKGYLAAFEAAGCGELIMFPCSGDPAQADLLGEAVK